MQNQHLINVGQAVAFRLADAFHAQVKEVSEKLQSDQDIEGRVISFSDSGLNKKKFAIVEVDSIAGLFVVPTACLRLVGQ